MKVENWDKEVQVPCYFVLFFGSQLKMTLTVSHLKVWIGLDFKTIALAESEIYGRHYTKIVIFPEKTLHIYTLIDDET